MERPTSTFQVQPSSLTSQLTLRAANSLPSRLKFRASLSRWQAGEKADVWEEIQTVHTTRLRWPLSLPLFSMITRGRDPSEAHSPTLASCPRRPSLTFLCFLSAQ